MVLVVMARPVPPTLPGVCRNMEATLSKTDVQAVLEALGRGITESDPDGIAACFGLPAMFVGEEGALVLNNEDELKGLFAQGRKFYEGRGLVGTRPDIEKIEPLSSQIFEVTVRWPGYDSSAIERWSERSRYVLRQDETGKHRICVAVTLGGGPV